MEEIIFLSRLRYCKATARLLQFSFEILVRKTKAYGLCFTFVTKTQLFIFKMSEAKLDIQRFIKFC